MSDVAVKRRDGFLGLSVACSPSCASPTGKKPCASRFLPFPSLTPSLTASTTPPPARPPLFSPPSKITAEALPGLDRSEPDMFSCFPAASEPLGHAPPCPFPSLKVHYRDSRPKNAECRDWSGTKPEWGRSEKEKKKRNEEPESTEQESPLPPPALTI